MTDPIVERAIPILPADDLSVSREFYEGRLGFAVTFVASEDGKSGLMGVARGTIELTIDAPMSGHGRNACAALHVHDADTLYQEWLGKVEMPRAPMNEAWGARTFSVHDPSGNTLFVIGPTSPA